MNTENSQVEAGSHFAQWECSFKLLLTYASQILKFPHSFEPAFSSRIDILGGGHQPRIGLFFKAHYSNDFSWGINLDDLKGSYVS